MSVVTHPKHVEWLEQERVQLLSENELLTKRNERLEDKIEDLLFRIELLEAAQEFAERPGRSRANLNLWDRIRRGMSIWMIGI